MIYIYIYILIQNYDILCSFQPQRAATNALTTIIHQNYQQPWLTWGEIKAAKVGDVPVWKRFFNAFKVSYSFIVKVELILVD
jgi:hypothetical protein